MVVYRIGRTKWIDKLNGEGSRKWAGRWNHVGKPCIYTAESRALALLEYSVNTKADDIPRFLSIATIEIPDDFIDNPVSELPGDWRDSQVYFSTQEYGSKLLKSRKCAIIRYPSVIISKEFNYVLNPLHKDSKLFKIVDVEDLVYDIRIKVA